MSILRQTPLAVAVTPNAADWLSAVPAEYTRIWLYQPELLTLNWTPHAGYLSSVLRLMM